MAVHVIEYQTVELEIPSQKRSEEILPRVQALFEGFVAGDLGVLLDKVDTGNIIQIDKLELDLGSVLFDKMAEQIRDKLKNKLSEYLSILNDPILKNDDSKSRLKTEVFLAVRPEDYYIDSWHFFLDKGFFPSSFYMNFSELKKTIEKLLQEKEDNTGLLSSFFSFRNERSIRRFVNHADGHLLYYAVKYLGGKEVILNTMTWKEAQHLLLLFLRKYYAPENNTLCAEEYRNILAYCFSYPSSIKTLLLVNDHNNNYEKWKNEYMHNALPVIKQTKEITIHHSDKKIGSEGLFVKNAGIVISAAFIPALFNKLELVKEGRFENIANRDMAILLISYLATGQKLITEDDLAFSKILCNANIDDVVDVNQILPDYYYTEADELMKSIKEHWQVMKSSSDEALRDTFFKRSGKLSEVEEYWLLQVENSGVDILLDKIPWPFRTIKLPWLNKSILVEWY